MAELLSSLKVATDETYLYTALTLGLVVDVNDPQQMGRLRIMVPALGDSQTTKIKNIPWAIYVSSFGGSNMRGTRGRGEDVTTGQVAYGFWNIPKVGSYVLIGCIDGDPNHRFWLGSIADQYLAHTMPHGRFSYSKSEGVSASPAGPFSSTEQPIEPLATNMKAAFSNFVDSFEFRTRVADNQVTGLDGQNVSKALSGTADDKDVSFTEEDGNTIVSRQGYQKSRQFPNYKFTSTGGNYDSQVFSWTTPGFHSVSMDDSSQNCRVRIRTTGGHQVIFDDTNERIYISTMKGNNWIEMDENGNIDIYSSRRISFHAKKDINFEVGGAFRVKAAGGIHMYSGDEFRLHSLADTNILSMQNIRMHSIADTKIHTEQAMDLKSVTRTNIESDADIDLLAGTCLKLTSTDSLNLKSTAEIINTGSEIHFNGPEAADATPAERADEKEAWWTNRVPQHEPWGRIMMINTDKNEDNEHTPQFVYADAKVGRVELAEKILRNPKWHR